MDIGAKDLIYLVILVNLLRWGCQSWALTKFLPKQLEVFHMRRIRRILKIKWDDVRELKIKNVQVGEKFKNIDTIENIISKRRIIFIGKIIRMPCKYISARFISVFQRNKRPIGRPNITVRHSFINDIEKIVSNVDPSGTFNSWAHIAFDEKRWTNLFKNLESKQAK